MDQVIWQKFTEKRYLEVLNDAGAALREHHALDYLHVSGLALIAIGDIIKGMDFVAASLSLADAPPAWFSNGATAMMEQEQYAYAILFLTNGLKEHPNDIKMTYMQGLCHVHIHEWGMAIGFFKQTLALDPAFYHAHLGIGFCHHMLGEYETALTCYTAIEHGTQEDMETVHNNHACVLMELGKQREALDYLLQHCPGSERAGTLYNMSFLYLGLGEWPLGWQLYRYRETVAVSKSKLFTGFGSAVVPKTDYPIARSLQEIHGRHLLLFHEQGFGDTIQFIRYARKLQHIASHITIGVPQPLHRLVECLDMEVAFTDTSFRVVSDEKDAIDCDVSMPMLDAPILFETTVNTIPAYEKYFTVSNAVKKQHLLSPTQKTRVGVCWAGASRLDNIRAFSIDRRRSIPFDMMKPLLRMARDYPVAFYSLQLADHHKEHPGLLRTLKDNFDMLDTAAIIDQLDLVITIDSAVAHLAGALGKPTWLLSRFDGCWRWFWNNEINTPWYPSMTIFRQQKHNSWPHVIDEVGRRLRGLL